MKSKVSVYLALIMLISTSHFSCGTSRKTQGAVIGTVIGGTAGAVLSDDNKAVSIIIGAAVGGVAGGLIGAYMDKQAEDIADDMGEYATVTRVGEGIVVTFESGLLFDFDSYAIKPGTRENLNKLAGSLNEYDKTNVNILGHTDSTGSDKYNQQLSENRATAVKNYIASQGVASTRLTTSGQGETDPVATNDTEEGRTLNRRVEIVIVANEELKEDAREGEIK